MFLCTALLHTARSQWTPAPNAIKLSDSLVFATSASITGASLVWHPLNQRYYSLRVGNSAFPLCTWLPSGGPSIALTTAGVDTRGMWFNPTTAQVERNCFAAIGWATMGIDGSLNATNAFTMIFTGALQPGTQSGGTFDPATNTVLFYSAGNVQIRSRATGTVLQTLALSGVSLANVTPDCMIHTGQLGYEIGLLDFVSKQVLFFSRTTGAYSGMCQLPPTAVTSSGYRLGYTNNRFWLLNSTTKTWNAYCIWSEQCAMILPVELVEWKGGCAEGRIRLTWATASEANSSHFVVERSQDAQQWEPVGQVPAAGHSQHVIEYAWGDASPLSRSIVYYRLRQVDLDGHDELFPTLHLQACTQEGTTLLLFPNPAEDQLNLQLIAPKERDRPVIIAVHDMQGRVVLRRNASTTDGQLHTVLEVNGLAQGNYELRMQGTDGGPLGSARFVKR